MLGLVLFENDKRYKELINQDMNDDPEPTLETEVEFIPKN